MSSSTPLPDSPLFMRQRSSTHSPRRLSVFGRSRSNTATSSSSSYKSPASSMTSDGSSSHRSSQDGRTLSTLLLPSEKPESTPKSLLSRRSRILKRQGSSKFSISSTLVLTEHDEMKEPEKPQGLGIFYRSHKSRHSDTHDLIKRTISDPFDFQHITHTSPGQLPPLNHTHPQDLATEFSVIRASQRPIKELKGIKADNLHFKNFSSEDVSSLDTQSLYNKSPPHSPDSQRSPTPPRGLGSKRASRSVENFSRPVSRLQKQTKSPTIIPPPRSSSRLTYGSDLPEPTCQHIDELLGLHSPKTFPEYVYTSPEEIGEQGSALSRLDLAAVFHVNEVTHAVTTDDDTAKIIRPPLISPHSSDLADVPEEDEFSPWRNSYVPNAAAPLNPTIGPIAAQQTLHADIVKPLPASPLPHILTNSEALGSPVIPSYRTEVAESPVLDDSRLKRRQSMGVRYLAEDSWEDDIDYCYEHAAEADCEFDWQRDSLDETDARAAFNGLFLDDNQDTENPNNAYCRQVEHSVVANAESQSEGTVYDQHESETHLAESDGTTMCLPSHKPVHSISYFDPEPIALLKPELDDVPPESMYAGLMHDDVRDCDDHFPLYSQAEVQIPSSRGSCSPLSKCNSQESIILSRAGSIARKHRSSLSTTSVPDLVHSASCSCETVDRDTISLSSEQSIVGCVPPSPVVATYHQRSKSLAKEASRHLASIIDPGFENYPDNGSSVPPPPTHDRSMSTSVLDMHDPTGLMRYPANRYRSPTIIRGVGSRRTRTSYSLFPTAASPPPSGAR
ncbi:hypothetical protein AJ80_02726 [Polytolypa hystricis UAMH7299]|uniref:CRIB domain-containing protein n=1 Tax=Polytolypa hystricis (strain UAMH7299) TaxID=1447883 RepID=A0A2B7YNG9_POLH7|nr:hypothetical protein AJ80_02726 [Polytolypa hystricis UAMH7299]